MISLVLPRLEDTIYTFDENISKDPQSLDRKVAGTLKIFNSELRSLWLLAAGNEQLSPSLRCLAAKQLVSSCPVAVAYFWIIWGVPVTFLSMNLGSFGNVFIKSGANIVSSNLGMTRLNTHCIWYDVQYSILSHFSFTMAWTMAVQELV